MKTCPECNREVEDTVHICDCGHWFEIDESTLEISDLEQPGLGSSEGDMNDNSCPDEEFDGPSVVVDKVAQVIDSDEAMTRTVPVPTGDSPPSVEEDIKSKAASGPSEDESESVEQPVSLEIDGNGMLQEGFAGTMKFKVRNVSGGTLDNISVDIESWTLEQKTRPRLKSLKPGHEKELNVGVQPSIPGNPPMELSLRFQTGSNTSCLYEGCMMIGINPKKPGSHTTIIRINESVVDLENARINPETKMISLVEKKHVHKWLPIELELEEKRSGDYATRFTVPKDELEPAHRATLKCSAGTGEKRILILTEDNVQFGRSRSGHVPGERKNDILLRVFPRTGRNNKLSEQISRVHFVLALGPKHVEVKDTGTEGKGSLCGTYINGERIEPMKPAYVLDGDTIHVAEKKALGFNVSIQWGNDVFRWPATICDKQRIRTVQSPRDARDDDEILSVRMVRTDGFRDTEEYVILRRETFIGTARDCGIRLSADGVMRRHARLIYHDGMFLIASMSDESPVSVDGQRLREKELVPLRYGARLRIGEVRIAFARFAQKLK